MKDKTEITYMIICSDGESPMPLRDQRSLDETKKDFTYFKNKYPKGKFTLWQEKTILSELTTNNL